MPATKYKQWTPVNTMARDIAHRLQSHGYLRNVSPEPGRKRMQEVVDLIEPFLWTIVNELDDPLA